MKTCSMRGWSTSHFWVLLLVWLPRLSAMTVMVPVGLACYKQAEELLPVGTVARRGAHGDLLAVADA